MSAEDWPVYDEGGLRIEVEDVSHHRNGVGGESFDVVTFSAMVDTTHDQIEVWQGAPVTLAREPFVAVVFDASGVLSVLWLKDPHRPWRGDAFEPHLRAAIKYAGDCAYPTGPGDGEVDR